MFFRILDVHQEKFVFFSLIDSSCFEKIIILYQVLDRKKTQTEKYFNPDQAGVSCDLQLGAASIASFCECYD